MRKYIFITIILLFISDLLIAQDSNFDWKTQDYTMHFNINNQRDIRTVRSPFYKVNAFVNDNVSIFWDQTENGVTDYQPVNGWNLVHYNFGDATTSLGDLPPYPYLILYNKYTSVLRVFYFVRDFSNSNGATIALEHARGQSAIYSSAYAVKSALVDFDNEVLLKLPNAYLNSPNQTDDNWWLHADFPLMYDPCGHNTVQSFRIGVVASTLQNINWTTVGTQESESEESVADGTGSQATGDGSKSAISEYRGIIQTGIKYTGSIKNLNDKYNLSDKFKKFTEDRKVDGKIADNFADKAKKVIGKVGGSVLKAVPVIGTALSLLDGFIGLFDSSDEGGASVAAVPSKYFINLTSTGTIITDFPLNTKQFKVPGSKNVVNSDVTSFYNQPVGVFNVLEAPVVEFAEFRGNKYRVIQLCTPFCQDFLKSPDFTIREYHIKDDIKFAINPASGLELVDVEFHNVIDVS